ncbi:MAG: hypothetical protein H6659_17890 [Ardenticatenaceae bacterium]|nr:hypothetical protein [Anaerolineales bacterium]MCB8985704.1 hypothetical protein [Ardenticatenaceae bacterium]
MMALWETETQELTDAADKCGFFTIFICSYPLYPFVSASFSDLPTWEKVKEK